MIKITPFGLAKSPRLPEPDQPGVELVGESPPRPLDLYRQALSSPGKPELTAEQTRGSTIYSYQTVSGVKMLLAKAPDYLAYQAILPAGHGLLPFALSITNLIEAGKPGKCVVRSLEANPKEFAVDTSPLPSKLSKTLEPSVRIDLGATEVFFEPDHLAYAMLAKGGLMAVEIGADGTRLTQVGTDITILHPAGGPPRASEPDFWPNHLKARTIPGGYQVTSGHGLFPKLVGMPKTETQVLGFETIPDHELLGIPPAEAGSAYCQLPLPLQGKVKNP